MMNIWQLKAKEEAKKKTSKTSPAQLRAQKDVSELDLPPTMRTVFPDTTDLMHFKLFITPDEGIYKDATFEFSFEISNNYPHQAPKVKCVNKIYHPNVDLEGNVCLNILREDWNPVLNLNGVMVGLQFLFLEPNADDPLNKDAAEALRRDRKTFARDARASLSGRSLGGVSYDKLL